MYVPWAGLALPCFPSRHPDSCLPLASAFATSCPAHRGEADVQFGLLADAASLGETDSVDRYLYTVWASGPSNSKRIASCGAVSCEVSCLIMLSLMAPRVCTLVLSCSFLFHFASPFIHLLHHCIIVMRCIYFVVSKFAETLCAYMCVHARTKALHMCSQISAVNNLHYQP